MILVLWISFATAAVVYAMTGWWPAIPLIVLTPIALCFLFLLMVPKPRRKRTSTF